MLLLMLTFARNRELLLASLSVRVGSKLFISIHFQGKNMSLTLYSPNLGADGVTHDVYAILARYATTRIPEFTIAILPGDAETRDKDANAKRLRQEADLFIVERLRMPNPNSEGKSVIVYRTTVRINGLKPYVAACYTNITAHVSLGIAPLAPDDLVSIGQHVDKTSMLGLWESLLQIERLRRFRFH